MSTPSVPPVVLYDGICGLCDRFVQFVIERDRLARFRFAPLQSEHARRALDARPSSRPALESICVIDPDGRVLRRSRAVLYVLRRLNAAWPIAGFVALLVPRFVADAAYDLIARSRYRFFGRLDACRLPTAVERERFLD